MVNPFADCPYYHKREFVFYLTKFKGWSKSRANKLPVRQLRAIWLEHHKKANCYCPDYDVDESGQVFQETCSYCS